MPSRQYAYQYDTNPRKIKPDYDVPKNKKIQYKKKTTAKKQKKNKELDKAIAKAKLKNNVKEQKKLQTKAKISIFMKCLVIFAILFLIIFRNSQISQSFANIQNMKLQIAELQKENDQLEINIQNSINLSNIEQQAKELLGMQKLSNKQTEYISLPKKDYIEPRTEEVIIEEQKGIVDTIIEKVKNIF